MRKKYCCMHVQAEKLLEQTRELILIYDKVNRLKMVDDSLI